MEDEYELEPWIGAPGAGGPVPARSATVPWKIPQQRAPTVFPWSKHPVDPSGSSSWKSLASRPTYPLLGIDVDVLRKGYPRSGYMDVYRGMHVNPEIYKAANADFELRGRCKVGPVVPIKKGGPRAKIKTPADLIFRDARINPGDYVTPRQETAQKFQRGVKGGMALWPDDRMGKLLHRRIPVEDLFYNTGQAHTDAASGSTRPPHELKYIPKGTSPPVAFAKGSEHSVSGKGQWPGLDKAKAAEKITFPKPGKPHVPATGARGYGPMLKGGGLNLGLMLALPDLGSASQQEFEKQQRARLPHPYFETGI